MPIEVKKIEGPKKLQEFLNSSPHLNILGITQKGSWYTVELDSYPSWWKINSLDPSDILGVWDFAWNGINTRDEALTPLEGTMQSFVLEEGDPGWSKDTGINFGGSGVIKSELPEVTVNELSTIIQFSDSVQNGTLDAFFSHFLDSSHYTLQNKHSENMVRWSCGDGDSLTTEISGRMLTEGVYGVSGPSLYANGLKIAVVPDSTLVTSTGLDFRLGAIWVGNNTQYIKAKIQKILIVKRILTDEEQRLIYERMTGQSHTNKLYDNGELVTDKGNIIYT